VSESIDLSAALSLLSPDEPKVSRNQTVERVWGVRACRASCVLNDRILVRNPYFRGNSRHVVDL
jgi:hypothetical protein